MSVQVRARREAAAFLSSFVGAQGELLVDTTNNRVQVHDGVTPGGSPAAKLGEVVTNTRTSVADAAYTALAGDRTIAVTSLSAPRTITLPAAAAYPTGTQLLVFDESGACSAANAIAIVRAGTDTINGVTSASITTAYGYLAFESNGAGKWTVVDQTTSSGTAIRTPIADANYGALTSDRVIGYTSITAARTVTLPAASGFPVGTRLLVLDESGNASATNTIMLVRAGSDTINGTTSAVISAAYGYIAVQSNGASKWTVTDQPSSTAVSVAPGALGGLTLSNNGTTSIDVAPGSATTSDNMARGTLTATLTKTPTTAWIAGNGGGLDTGTPGFAWYYVHLIYNPTSGATDVVFSINAVTPSFPSGYTKNRRIGSIFYSGSVITSFKQVDDEIITSSTVAASNVSINTTSTLINVSVPPSIRVTARLRVSFSSAAVGTAYQIGAPDIGESAGADNATILAQVANVAAAAQVDVRTSSQQVRAVASAAGTHSIRTIGWIDTRGK